VHMELATITFTCRAALAASQASVLSDWSRMATSMTAACTVTFTLMRLERGCVETKQASTSFTCGHMLEDSLRCGAVLASSLIQEWSALAMMISMIQLMSPSLKPAMMPGR